MVALFLWRSAMFSSGDPFAERPGVPEWRNGSAADL
jgi:hypothetical protein